MGGWRGIGCPPRWIVPEGLEAIFGGGVGVVVVDAGEVGFFWIEGDGEGGGVVVCWWSPTVIKPRPLGAAVAKKSRKRVGMWCSSLVMGGAFLPNA